MDPHLTFADLERQLATILAGDPELVTAAVELILADASARQASDVHIDPAPAGLEIRYRLDGVLLPVAKVESPRCQNIIARLKVLSELLTYRIDVPQEGRLIEAEDKYDTGMRVSTFPTIHGEKAVIRLFPKHQQVLTLDQLGLGSQQSTLEGLLSKRSGALFLTGPAGAGKTTTIYACLRYLIHSSSGQKSIVTIEDPVEQVLAGVSQSQVRSGSEFDFARGLRSLLRQDPEVIMVGEARDRETAAIAIEAGLTGHLVITTMHSGSACGVISRLLEMGIEPHLLTSGIIGVMNQRLVRRRCHECRGHGCARCCETGYSGRILLAEFLKPTRQLGEAIMEKGDVQRLESALREDHRFLQAEADAAIAEGLTTRFEVDRVLGKED